uniref:Putative secreted protein n=1 Tax=Anopheles triannulatus TaxID=58253 RepID=A0A2M4B1A7_9DIPT
MLNNQLLLLLLLLHQVFSRTTKLRHRYCNRMHLTWESNHRPQHQQPREAISRNVLPELMLRQLAIAAPAAGRPCLVLV